MQSRLSLRSLGLLTFVAAAAPLATGAVLLAAAQPQKPAALHLANLAPATLEPGEESPGGGATTRRSMVNRDVFSQPSQGISFEGESNFRIGNSIFRRLWVTAPSSTDSSDGLGPLYNARGCQNCHLKDGRGHPPNANHPDDDAVSMFLRLSVPPKTEEEKKLLAEHRVNSLPEPTYGAQLQDFAIQGFDVEGRMYITYKEEPVKLRGGETVRLRKPNYEVRDLAFGPLSPDTMLSPRVAPQMIGLGLLEAIPEEVIRARADPDDTDGDGISGRTNEVWSLEHERVMLGRFGWKAGIPTIRQQTAEAFAGDIGLSTTLVPHPAGDCTPAQKACLEAPNGNSERNDNSEIGNKLFDLVAFYAENLAVPPRRGPERPDVLKGKALFTALGCAACHVPSTKTGDMPHQPWLSNQTIWPYTDLLLHDMGEGLADNRPEGVADGREWRTPPLWGVGLTEAVSRHTFLLHDGRARNVEEAILWHGGEAQKARDMYRELRKEDREALLAFVKSL